jgi:AcrR family transcriptional regulator
VSTNSVSTTGSDSLTRSTILATATSMLEERPDQPLTMGDVARRAGISRQAVYLHFRDRAELLLEVSRRADTAARTPARQRRVDAAPTARAALREAVAVQAEIKPKLRGVATALDVLRRADGAADAAWHEREQARLARCRIVVQRLHDEGELAADQTVEDAAQLMWAVTSQRVWDDLVVDQRWTQKRYRGHITRLLEQALLHHP